LLKKATAPAALGKEDKGGDDDDFFPPLLLGRSTK
jgi:hypothetical protein